MTHVHIRGPLLSISGYGVHARQIARWAFAQNFHVTTDITPWGITPWYTDREECNGLINKIMEASSPLKSKPDVSFQVMLPNEWDHTIAKRNFGVTAAVETNICASKWILACQRMDHVIVPSEFAKRCLVNTGLKSKRVTVIPESFIDTCVEKPIELDLEFETEDNYLLLGQISGDPETDRKNTAYTLALFCEEFKNDPNVGLIIKTNYGSNSTVDRAATKRRLGSIVNQVRKGSFPKVYLVHGYLKDREVSSLYKHPKVKGLISFTHGEGFGLPMLEAAACGLPVCATDWSAHTEFLNLGNWTRVKSKLSDVPFKKIDGSIFVAGAKWADITPKDARSTLRKFVSEEKPDTLELQRIIRNKYSFETISQKYDAFWKRWR